MSFYCYFVSRVSARLYQSVAAREAVCPAAVASGPDQLAPPLRALLLQAAMPECVLPPSLHHACVWDLLQEDMCAWSLQT